MCTFPRLYKESPFLSFLETHFSSFNMQMPYRKKKDECTKNLVYTLSLGSQDHASSALNVMTNPFSPSESPFTVAKANPQCVVSLIKLLKVACFTSVKEIIYQKETPNPRSILFARRVKSRAVNQQWERQCFSLSVQLYCLSTYPLSTERSQKDWPLSSEACSAWVSCELFLRRRMHTYTLWVGQIWESKEMIPPKPSLVNQSI